MPEAKSVALTRLERISEILGIDIDQFMTRSALGDLSTSDEYFRLWSLLKTERGRQQALDALRRVIDEEDLA